MILTDINQINNIDIKPIENIDEAKYCIKKLELELRLSNINGIGLAMNQIGGDRAVAIIRIPASIYNEEIKIDLINPALTDGDGYCMPEEGCLSFPNKSVRTIRFIDIDIETMIDYNAESNIINNDRYEINPNISSSNYEKRIIHLDGLASIVAQHELGHLCKLTFLDFKPQEVGRNDKCPCGSEKKNKKCHNFTHYNSNLKKLFNPCYRSAK